MENLTESSKRNITISKIEMELKTNAEKEKLLEELCGAWADIDEVELIKDIYESRTFSDKQIDLD